MGNLIKPPGINEYGNISELQLQSSALGLTPTLDFFVEISNNLTSQEVTQIIKGKEKFNNFNNIFRNIVNLDINEYLNRNDVRYPIDNPEMISDYGARYLLESGLNPNQRNSLAGQSRFKDNAGKSYVLDPVHRGIDCQNKNQAPDGKFKPQTDNVYNVYAVCNGEMYISKKSDNDLGGVIIIRNFILQTNAEGLEINTKKVYTGLCFVYAHMNSYLDDKEKSAQFNGSDRYIKDVSAKDIIGKYDASKQHLHFESFFILNEQTRNTEKIKLSDIRNFKPDIQTYDDNDFNPEFIDQFNHEKNVAKISVTNQTKVGDLTPINSSETNSSSDHDIKILTFIDFVDANSNKQYLKYIRKFFPSDYSNSIDVNLTKNIYVKVANNEGKYRFNFFGNTISFNTSFNIKKSDLEDFGDKYLNKVRFIRRQKITRPNEDFEFSISCTEYLQLLKDTNYYNIYKTGDDANISEKAEIDSIDSFFELFIPLKINLPTTISNAFTLNKDSTTYSDSSYIIKKEDFINKLFKNLNFKDKEIYFLVYKFNDLNFNLKFKAKYIQESNNYSFNLQALEKNYKNIDAKIFLLKNNKLTNIFDNPGALAADFNQYILNLEFKEEITDSDTRSINTYTFKDLDIYKCTVNCDTTLNDKFKFTTNLNLTPKDTVNKLLSLNTDYVKFSNIVSNNISYKVLKHVGLNYSIPTKFIGYDGANYDMYSAREYSGRIINKDTGLFNSKIENASIKDIFSVGKPVMFDYEYNNMFTAPFIISPFLPHQIVLSNKIYYAKYDGNYKDGGQKTSELANKEIFSFQKKDNEYICELNYKELYYWILENIINIDIFLITE